MLVSTALNPKPLVSSNRTLLLQVSRPGNLQGQSLQPGESACHLRKELFKLLGKRLTRNLIGFGATCIQVSVCSLGRLSASTCFCVEGMLKAAIIFRTCEDAFHVSSYSGGLKRIPIRDPFGGPRRDRPESWVNSPGPFWRMPMLKFRVL